MAALRASAAVKETVISCIEAPRLRGLSTRHFIAFKRLRELYEKQLEEKARHRKEEITPTSYRALIEEDDLRIFIAAGWVDCSSIDELTERQIVKCVEDRCTKEATGEELHLVDHAVKTVGMQMHVYEPEDRVWSLRRTYSQALKAAGYGGLIESRPHIAIQHFLKRLKPIQLYHRMVDIMNWRKNENFHRENFDRSFREVAIQARKTQSEQRNVPPAEKADSTPPRGSVATLVVSLCSAERGREKDSFSNKKTVNTVKTTPGRAVNARISRYEEKNEHSRKRKRDVYEAPLCLNPTCRTNGKRHYISNCDISEKAMKNSLLEQYRKANKARLEERSKPAGNISRITSTPTIPHSSLFKSTLGDGKIEIDVLADQGADANFISSSFLQQIKESAPSIISERLRPSQVYRNVTGDPCLTCNQSIKLDVFLRIRHGTSLILRNIIWKVTEEDLPTPIIGRRMLESFGCDSREMLLAARDKLGSDIDVDDVLKQDGNEESKEGMIAALYGEPVFHSEGQFEDDGLNDSEVYVDLGDDPMEEVNKELRERMKEAAADGLSEEETARLEQIIQRNKSVFRFRLRSGGPAKVTPMKITLDDSKKPVQVKVRKYSADQRRFLDAYFDELVKMGFLKLCPEASWQATPHLVPKDSKSKF